MITDDLIVRKLERASDRARRYLNAKDDEAGIELPVEEIDRREAEWTHRLLFRTDGADGRRLSEDAIERHLQEWKASRDETRHMIDEQTRAWGLVPPATKALFETESHFRVSTDPPGAKP